MRQHPKRKSESSFKNGRKKIPPKIWPVGFFSKYDINGIINPTAIINEHNLNKQLIQVIDIFGRESKGLKNQPLFYIYDDGTVEKKIIIE